jgi:hypothetical protein
MAYSGFHLASLAFIYLACVKQDRSLKCSSSKRRKSTDGDITLRLTVYSGDLTNVSQAHRYRFASGAFEQIIWDPVFQRVFVDKRICARRTD